MNKVSEKIDPPKWATRLFDYYCRNELNDSIIGDMQEQFYREVERGRIKRARLRYWLNVFSFINRHTLKRRSNSNSFSKNSMAMFKNYALITLRNFRRKPVFSIINVFGLAIGLASCMIIYFYVQRELSFDKFHKASDRIYKVASVIERGSNTLRWGRVPPAMAPAIRDNFPGIGKVTRLRYTDEHVYAVGDRIFSEQNGFFADSLYLEIFDFPLKSGDPATALDEPNSIVLTDELATRFFGETEPMGKLIRFDNEKSLKVTGVLKPLPTNSHIDFNLLISFSTYVVPEGYLANLNSWSWGGFHTYIQTDPGIDANLLSSRVSELYQSNYTRSETKVQAIFQPLEELYLGFENFANRGESIRVGDKSTLYTLSGIAVLVLLIAGLNFMNLSTAISMNRGKEIGMRKVMGAVRRKIKTQFLVESIMMALLSMTLAIVMVVVTEPMFKELLGIELPKSIDDYLRVVPLFVTATVIVGILSGIYPSLVLSSFNPIKALKGNLRSSKSGIWMRRTLTVIQFVVSASLMTGSLLIVRQTNFMMNKSLGFDQENVIVLKAIGVNMTDKYETLKNRIKQNPFVVEMTRASHTFNGSASSGPALLRGASPDDSHHLNYYQTGYDFLEVMDLELSQGRFLSRDFPNDTVQGLVLNETAVRQMGLEEPLGQRLRFNNRDRVVIGVIEDFNFRSLHTPIEALGIVMPFTFSETMLVKTRGGDMSGIISALESDWKAVLEGVPFDATFLDDGIQAMYENEMRLSKLVGIFSTLAVLLACLGLYGLVAFSVQARLKEVGIRKVLGGSINGMLVLLSKQFIGLIMIANLVAIPLTYFAGSNWLNNFSYRTEIGVVLFVLPMVVLAVIALITLSHQVVKAALTNPVKVLRNE